MTRAVEQAVEALKRAEQFITNGVELGFIRLPETATDPAHDTLPKVREALAALQALPVLPEGEGGSAGVSESGSSRSPPAAQHSDGGRDIESAPKDGTPILARISQLVTGSRWGHLSGRCFVIRHDGLTAGGYDMGWSVYPGLGGAPDEWFDHWMPLPAKTDLSSPQRSEGGQG